MQITWLLSMIIKNNHLSGQSFGSNGKLAIEIEIILDNCIKMS